MYLDGVLVARSLSLQAHVVGTYLLAQIRAASRASEETCSYSLETR